MNFQVFKQAFFNSRVNKKNLVKEIKTFNADYESLVKFVSRYKKELKSAKSLLNNAILGKNHLPKSYSELGSFEVQFFTDSLIQELNWQILGILDCHEVINKFILLRDKFENNLLIANYDKAREILDKIETDICISYWSIENRFILDEYQFGSEKNWETRNLILSEKNNAFVQIFGSHISFKTEKRVSFFQYNEEFNNWQNREGLNKIDDAEGIIEFFRFKENYFSYGSYNRQEEIIYREANASIIDRYLMFIRIAQHQIAENTNILNSLLPLLHELSAKIDDIHLMQMTIATDNSFLLTNDDYNTNVIVILDEYTKGNYSKSKELAKRYITEESSNCIELYEIYAKSLVELKLPYEPLTNQECLANEISSNYFNVLEKNSNTDSSLVDLLKLSYTFNNNHVGLHLYAFITEQLGWEVQTDYFFLRDLNSKFVNPRLLGNLYKKESVAKNFLYNIELTLKSSNSVHLAKQLLVSFSSEKSPIHFENVSENKNNLYKIRSLLRKNKLDECITYSEKLLKDSNISVNTEYEVVSALFSCYFKKKDYRRSAILFVNTHLKNIHFTKRMMVDDLNDTILKGKFKNVGERANLIELPILLKVSNVDKIKVKQAYELFLRGNQVDKPSELLIHSQKFLNKKFIYFLKNVCTPEIMQLSKYFNSTYEVNQERISIVKYLAENEPEDLEGNKHEIAELTQKNTISKVIGGIDERKIFVNEQKIRQTIKRTEKQNVLQGEQISPLTKESFERYAKLLAYVKNKNEYKDVSSIIQFGENGEVTYIPPEKNKSYADQDVDVVLYLPAFRIFVAYFLSIRDLFIFNKEYGLNAYLSTRIRHGTLPNHLRSVFETYLLVTSQTDNIYSENDYWKEKLNLSEDKMQQVQDALRKFSEKVDAFSRNIKDVYIQCKNEQNLIDAGLFDYSYNEQELIFLFLEDFGDIDTIDDFIEKSFQELWSRTEQNLEVVRNKFDFEFRDAYIKQIDGLHQELLSIVSKNSISELLNNLMTCKTEIQTKLSNISKWFRRSESSFDGEYELQTLAEASIQITKNLNPNFNFEIVKIICPDFNVSGEFHQHIIDLINNCLFNIVKHSHLPCTEVEAKLIIEENGNDLIFRFENNVANAEEHQKKLTTIKKNWQSSDSNISKEGGTGFPKIKKIINSDLNRRYSNFNFNIENNRLAISISFETTNGLKV